MRIVLTLILCLILTVGFNINAGAEVSNRVVAVVNNDVITLYELNKKIEELTGHTGDKIRAMDEEKFLETRRNVLEILINEKITLEKIQELGIRVTQDEVDATIESIKKSNGLTQEDLLGELESKGIPYEKYRETLKTEIERARLINHEVKSKIIIREEDIKKDYEENREKFRVDEQVYISGIFLQNDGSLSKEGPDGLILKGEEILARLKKGEDFGELARTYSQGPGAKEGGDLGKFKTSQIDPEMLEILRDMPEGSVSGLIKRGNGIQIIKLIKRDGAGIKPFEEVRDAIYSERYKKEVNERYLSWIKNLRENTFTKITF